MVGVRSLFQTLPSVHRLRPFGFDLGYYFMEFGSTEADKKPRLETEKQSQLFCQKVKELL